MKPKRLLAFLAIAILEGCATPGVNALPDSVELARYHSFKVGAVRFAPGIAADLSDEERSSLTAQSSRTGARRPRFRCRSWR
jgi:hypothetical protein